MSASTNWFEARTPFSKKSIKPVQLYGKGVRNGWPSLHLTTTHILNHPPTLNGDVDGQGAVNRRNVATITMQWTVKHTHESNIQHPISPVVFIVDEGTHPTQPNHPTSSTTW